MIRITKYESLKTIWFISGETLKIDIMFSKFSLFIFQASMIFKFKEFILDTKRFELSRNNIVQHVEPQVIELLALLIANRDRMLSKDEIYDTVWRGRVVSESALSSRIKSARQVLGDDGKSQKVIKTIHKKGFRFIAEVMETEDQIDNKLIQPNQQSLLTDNSTHNKPAITILPFANLSKEPEQEYFADGISSDIITLLSKHRWLDVTARNTSFGFKGKAVNICEVGKLLSVDYVVEGSVQKAGKRIRVNAHLVDAKSGHQKWSERYDRELEDIFLLQDEITEKIVARLEPEIGFAERNKIVHARPANLKAWDLYHLGIYHFFKFTGQDNLTAQNLLLQSQELDVGFGEAYAWWAYAVTLGMIYWDTKPTQKLLDEALSACDTALSLDSQNASFYALRARVLLARKEYSRAIAENKMAIKLNATFAAAHCGLGDSLAYEGRYEESIHCFDKAISLSPNDPQLWAFYTYGALVLIFKGDYKKAIEWADIASSIPNCQYWTTAHKMVAYAYLGDEADVQIARKKLLQQRPGFSRDFAREKLFYLKKQEQVDLYIKGLELAGIL